jgi:FtsZ-binding cell division protein ZapB
VIEYNCERNDDMLFSKVKGIVDFRQLEQFNIDDGEKKLIENSSTERQKQRIARERENGRMKKCSY